MNKDEIKELYYKLTEWDVKYFQSSLSDEPILDKLLTMDKGVYNDAFMHVDDSYSPVSILLLAQVLKHALYDDGELSMVHYTIHYYNHIIDKSQEVSGWFVAPVDLEATSEELSGYYLKHMPSIVTKHMNKIVVDRCLFDMDTFDLLCSLKYNYSDGDACEDPITNAKKYYAEIKDVREKVLKYIKKGVRYERSE